MANLRTFYACQAINVARLEPDENNSYSAAQQGAVYEFIHGVQSVGINSSFDFENIFELGQLEIYDAVLNIPEVEITVEKVLDAHPTVYSLISNGDELKDASKNRASVKFAIYKDTENAGQSTPLNTITCTGMYVSNVTYTFPVDGNPTESVTLVGNSKSISTDTLSIPSGIVNGATTPDDEPLGGRVLRRQDVTYTGPGSTKAQNVTISIDLAREDIFEFGARLPYARIATYPIEVTAEVESLAIEDSFDNVVFNETTDQLPEENQSISVDCGGLSIDLGSKCFLTSIAHGGGDATGGNATVTRSYTTYNTFTVEYTANSQN